MKEFGIFTKSTMSDDFQTIAYENRCQPLDSPETDPAQNISRHPGMERWSRQYQVDVSYPKTWLADSRLTRRIPPSISSLRNEVQGHLNGSIQSSFMVSDLTPHAYSIQRPFLTSHRSLVTNDPTPWHASP